MAHKSSIPGAAPPDYRRCRCGEPARRLVPTVDAEITILVHVQYRCSTCGEDFGILKLPFLAAWLAAGFVLLALAIVSPFTPYQVLLCQMQFAPAATLQSLALGIGSVATFWAGGHAIYERLQHPFVKR